MYITESLQENNLLSTSSKKLVANSIYPSQQLDVRPPLPNAYKVSYELLRQFQEAHRVASSSDYAIHPCETPNAIQGASWVETFRLHAGHIYLKIASLHCLFQVLEACANCNFSSSLKLEVSSQWIMANATDIPVTQLSYCFLRKI